MLKPTKLTSNIFLYCLALAAKKTGVSIHAVCVISNHWHGIVSDPETKIAEFYAWLHKYVAKSVNASLGRFENMWSTEKTNVISLTEQKDVLDKILYILCNPVEARLVARGEKWPGVWLYKRSHSRTIERPKVYFIADGDMPERVELEIEPPPQFAELSAEAYECLIAGELEEKERRIQEEMNYRGQSFLGVRGVMKQRHYSGPVSKEKRFGLIPKIAGKNKWLRIEAIQRHKEFLVSYREAYKKWKEGDREVIFPAGTYALRVYAGVKCESG